MKAIPYIFYFLCYSTLVNAQCLQGNCTQGTGTYRYTTGSVYTGQFKNMREHGTGEMVWSNGDSYSGEWKNGTMHGKGTYTWASGNYYQGLFEMGKKVVMENITGSMVMFT